MYKNSLSTTIFYVNNNKKLNIINQIHLVHRVTIFNLFWKQLLFIGPFT